MANVIIEPDGPRFARSTSCVMVFQQTAELPLQPIIGGDYQDRFQKVGVCGVSSNGGSATTSSAS